MMIAYVVGRASLRPAEAPRDTEVFSWGQRLRALGAVAPALGLVVLVLGSIYTGIATATEAAALGVAGSLALAAIERSLSWESFRQGLVAACGVYCMIGLILAGAAFLTLAMGFIGLPRHLADIWQG